MKDQQRSKDCFTGFHGLYDEGISSEMGRENVEKPTRQLVSLESICWCPCIYSYSIPLTVSHHVNIYKVCHTFTTTAWAEVKSLVIFHLPHLRH